MRKTLLRISHRTTPTNFQSNILFRKKFFFQFEAKMSWFSNLSDTFGTLMEVVAPMPVEQKKLEEIQKVQEDRRKSTAGVGARLVAQRAMSKESRFQSPVRTQQLVRMPNDSETTSKSSRTPTVSIQPGLIIFFQRPNFASEKEHTWDKYPITIDHLSFKYTIVAFLKPTPVPVNIVQRAGRATPLPSIQAVNSTSLNKHYKIFQTLWCQLSKCEGEVSCKFKKSIKNRP